MTALSSTWPVCKVQSQRRLLYQSPVSAPPAPNQLVWSLASCMTVMSLNAWPLSCFSGTTSDNNIYSSDGKPDHSHCISVWLGWSHPTFLTVFRLGCYKSMGFAGPLRTRHSPSTWSANCCCFWPFFQHMTRAYLKAELSGGERGFLETWLGAWVPLCWPLEWLSHYHPFFSSVSLYLIPVICRPESWPIQSLSTFRYVSFKWKILPWSCVSHSAAVLFSLLLYRQNS